MSNKLLTISVPDVSLRVWRVEDQYGNELDISEVLLDIDNDITVIVQVPERDAEYVK